MEFIDLSHHPETGGLTEWWNGLLKRLSYSIKLATILYRAEAMLREANRLGVYALI
jgi:hypothetical protein